MPPSLPRLDYLGDHAGLVRVLVQILDENIVADGYITRQPFILDMLGDIAVEHVVRAFPGSSDRRRFHGGYIDRIQYRPAAVQWRHKIR
ncbi:hypothetical protein ACFLWI_02360 [Chloroflexota bacterium]